MTRLKPTLSENERKYVVNRLWRTIALVERGQTTFWTVEQLKHIAFEIQPFGSEYEDDIPVNEETA